MQDRDICKCPSLMLVCGGDILALHTDDGHADSDIRQPDPSPVSVIIVKTVNILLLPFKSSSSVDSGWFPS